MIKYIIRCNKCGSKMVPDIIGSGVSSFDDDEQVIVEEHGLVCTNEKCNNKIFLESNKFPY